MIHDPTTIVAIAAGAIHALAVGFFAHRHGRRQGYVRGLIEGVDAYLLELARRWHKGQDVFPLFNRALRDRLERDQRPITVIGTLTKAQAEKTLREVAHLKPRRMR